MGLLLRRRALLGQESLSLDGRECVAIGTNHNLYYSKDYGKTFTDSGVTSGGGYHACVTRDAETAHVYFVHSSGAVYHGDMYGKYSWASVGIGAIGLSICASADGTMAFVPLNAGSGWQTGYSCTIKKITRSGNTLSQATKATFSTWDQAGNYVSACSCNGRYAVIGGAAGFTNAFQTRDYGETWTECLATQSFGNGTNQVSCAADGNEFIATGPSGQNVGTQSLAGWYHEMDGQACYGNAVAGTFGVNEVHRVAKSDGLYIYDRAGKAGYSAAYTKVNSNRYTFLSTNASGNKIIGLLNGYIYYSHDWGRTWYQSSTPSGVTFAEISMAKYV